MSLLRRMPLYRLRLGKIRGTGDKGSFFSEGKNDPKGYLFNETPATPDSPRQWEAWEAPWYFTLGASVAILALGLPARPDSSLVSWADKQARAKENQ